MTVKELSQLYYLNREIEMDRRRLAELEQKTIPAPEIREERVSGNRTDTVGQKAAELADLRGLIEAKRRQCLCERNRLERYISGIEDSLLRQVFTYRFINGLPWRQVAACVGGGNTEDSVRKAAKRYLEK